MRIIDADALKEDLDTFNPAYERMVFWFKKVIDAQPTVNIKIPVQIIEYIGGKDGNRENN